MPETKSEVMKCGECELFCTGNCPSPHMDGDDEDNPACEPVQMAERYQKALNRITWLQRDEMPADRYTGDERYRRSRAIAIAEVSADAIRAHVKKSFGLKESVMHCGDCKLHKTDSCPLTAEGMTPNTLQQACLLGELWRERDDAVTSERLVKRALARKDKKLIESQARVNGLQTKILRMREKFASMEACPKCDGKLHSGYCPKCQIRWRFGR